MRPYRPGQLTDLYGIPAEWIAKVCGCHITTARRWKRGEEPPLAALTIIRLMSTGDLGWLDEAWRGWRIRDGQLFSPDDVPHTPGDVQGTFWYRQLVNHYQKLQRLPAQGDWIEGSWVPAREASAAPP
jgi:hypothetical protein